MASLYERLGGESAVNAAVDVFYKRVLNDPQLAPFFGGVDMRKQIAKQKAFLTYAFGGPNQYSGRTMRKAHEKAVQHGLNDTHFDAVVGHLGATLKGLGVSDDLIAEAAKIAESTRADVLNRSPAPAA